MPYVKSTQGNTSLFYIDYQPASKAIFRPDHDSITKHKDTTLFFIHGLPMSGRMYEHLMLPLSQTYGIRCIANDRRGFGKSEWNGSQPIDVTYDTFAQDTLVLIKSIQDLKPFVFVCSSMGCGESLLVYELMKQEGMQDLCKGFIWIGPTLPYPLKTETSPHAPPQEVWDVILDGFRQDRTGFVRASIGGVFGTQHGIEMSDTAQEFFVDLVKQADALAIERCCQILVNYDFTDKLKEFGKTKPADLKLTILHGAKDQSAPIEATSGPIKEYIPDAKLKICENAAHGLYYTAREEVIKDILAHLG